MCFCFLCNNSPICKCCLMHEETVELLKQQVLHGVRVQGILLSRQIERSENQAAVKRNSTYVYQSRLFQCHSISNSTQECGLRRWRRKVNESRACFQGNTLYYRHGHYESGPLNVLGRLASANALFFILQPIIQHKDNITKGSMSIQMSKTSIIEIHCFHIEN